MKKQLAARKAKEKQRKELPKQQPDDKTEKKDLNESKLRHVTWDRECSQACVWPATSSTVRWRCPCGCMLEDQCTSKLRIENPLRCAKCHHHCFYLTVQRSHCCELDRCITSLTSFSLMVRFLRTSRLINWSVTNFVCQSYPVPALLGCLESDLRWVSLVRRSNQCTHRSLLWLHVEGIVMWTCPSGIVGYLLYRSMQGLLGLRRVVTWFLAGVRLTIVLTKQPLRHLITCHIQC